MVNRMFNAMHEQSPACLKCPNMHKFAHIECASLYDNAQIRRLSCVDSWVTQVTHVTTAYVIITVYVISTACVIKNQLLM